MAAGPITYVAATLLFIAICGGAWLVTEMLYRQKYATVVSITNFTSGKEVIEQYRGRKISIKGQGDVYLVPKLKKEQREIIPDFGSRKLYPMKGGKTWFYTVCYANNTYAPMDIAAEETVKFKVLVRKEGDETHVVARLKDINKVNHIKDLSKNNDYSIEEREFKEFIVKPLKSSIRAFNLRADLIRQRQYNLDDRGEKWRQLLMHVTVIGASVTISILIILFSYKTGQDLASGTANTPEWAKNILDTMTNQPPG